MRKNALICALTFVFLFIGTECSAQTIIRQNIGSLGGSFESENIYTAAAVGQSFDVSTTYSKVQYTPGFIQPLRTYISLKEEQLHLNVFPNPARNEVKIELDLSVTNLNLVVTDLHGRMVHEQNYNGEGNISFDCSLWAIGTYLVTVSCDEYKPQTTKLLINH